MLVAVLAPTVAWSVNGPVAGWATMATAVSTMVAAGVTGRVPVGVTGGMVTVKVEALTGLLEVKTPAKGSGEPNPVLELETPTRPPLSFSHTRPELRVWVTGRLAAMAHATLTVVWTWTRSP